MTRNNPGASARRHTSGNTGNSHPQHGRRSNHQGQRDSGHGHSGPMREQGAFGSGRGSQSHQHSNNFDNGPGYSHHGSRPVLQVRSRPGIGANSVHDHGHGGNGYSSPDPRRRGGNNNLHIPPYSLGSSTSEYSSGSDESDEGYGGHAVHPDDTSSAPHGVGPRDWVNRQHFVQNQHIRQGPGAGYSHSTLSDSGSTSGGESGHVDIGRQGIDPRYFNWNASGFFSASDSESEDESPMPHGRRGSRHPGGHGAYGSGFHPARRDAVDYGRPSRR